jgi:hypothetical protein
MGVFRTKCKIGGDTLKDNHGTAFVGCFPIKENHRTESQGDAEGTLQSAKERIPRVLSD